MDKISTIKARILTFLSEQGIKKALFFEETAISSANFKGKNLYSEIGGDKLVKILSLYSSLSAEWLLRGTGEMLLNNSDGSEEGHIINSSNKLKTDSDITQLFIEQLNLYQEKNLKLAEEIGRLKEQIKALKRGEEQTDVASVSVSSGILKDSTNGENTNHLETIDPSTNYSLKRSSCAGSPTSTK